MEITKEKINKYFDDNGITFSECIAFISIEHDYFGNITEVSELDYNKEENKLIKIHTPFNISEDKINELVLSYIYDTTGVLIPNVNLLPKYKILNGKPFLIELQSDSTNIYNRFILPWKEINGDVFFRGDKGNDYIGFSNTKTINGSLSIYDSAVKNMGQIEIVKGDFIFSASKESQINKKCKLKSLNPLKYVQGNVVIRSNSINTLGTLQFVGGNLSLRYSQVKDVGQLKVVRGNLLISKYNLKYMNLDNVLVMGKIRIYNDPEISPYI